MTAGKSLRIRHKVCVWGLPYKTNEVACRLSLGCKFWILVSLQGVSGKAPIF